MNDKPDWIKRLNRGLSRSSEKLVGGIGDLLIKRKLDDGTLVELEELLISADLGAATAAKLTRALADKRFGKEAPVETALAALAEAIAEILAPAAVPLIIDSVRKPHVVLVCGVNGSGKTTTIGKMAKLLGDQELAVTLVAGDTFRAAAVEQLGKWGERSGCPVISGAPGADAAGLVYGAMEKARNSGADVLMIDTAGRLHNKAHLMEELSKIIRVLKKLDATAPHDCLLVLDATIGQNAHNQVQAFKEMVDVTGLILTKLDGSAKGGVVVALADKFALPIHAVGVGESIEDLRPFEARSFARSLMGLDPIYGER
ncbi:MAG: signal recognition particle-docking protein FtsY [Rhodospirillales bacterium RIFCSPLOWO2_12_FULL_58_28]|nr:MAG: signal recognition particle-docking protein FtsY [Rhodospirillales bacterium RIFCSPLOWO2_02_FULL_58_16]OHC78090.1 MAG: signal recognition particle-docking protein FtsY [Rhodospirillales bacterium RIFCSPLOWO2_12_FULL_58_28]